MAHNILLRQADGHTKELASTESAAGVHTLHVVEVSPTTSTNSLSASTADEASRVVKASAGVLHGFVVRNKKTSSQWIQFHDASSLPADTAVPLFALEIGAGQQLAVDAAEGGIPFSTGIVICNSSTEYTKTIGSADCAFVVEYS